MSAQPVTAMPRRLATGLAALAVIGLVAAACGGSAATPAPATPAPATPAPTAAPATPAPTEAPATPAPTEAPSVEAPSLDAGTPDPADNGGFAFSAKDLMDYYTSEEGFQCEDPTPSTQAAGYTVQRCIHDAGNGVSELIAFVVDADGVMGDAFAAYLLDAGSAMPDPADAAPFLSGFSAGLLGTDVFTNDALPWLQENLGKDSAQTEISGLLYGTYTEDDDGGVGLYVESANQAFMDAPAP